MGSGAGSTDLCAEDVCPARSWNVLQVKWGAGGGINHMPLSQVTLQPASSLSSCVETSSRDFLLLSRRGPVLLRRRAGRPVSLQEKALLPQDSLSSGKMDLFKIHVSPSPC